MGELELKWEPDGPRYYLAGKPVHAGDILEAMLHDGTWITIRFEYYWDRKQFVEPHLIVSDDGDSKQLLPDDTKCRWPE